MTSRTALVLLAPRVDHELRGLRERYFRNLERRMPAHVTMLFPFRSNVGDDTLATIDAVSRGLRVFDATFRESGRFRDDVVWLQPEPTAEFERASDAVLAAFPDCAPYGGAHVGRMLHLTVASRLRGNEADQLLVELAGAAPLAERIERLSLMSETGSGWAETRSWPLAERR